MRRTQRRKNLSFLTQNQHYQNLHLLLYFVTVIVITFIYFITLLVFSKYIHTFIFAIISLVIGIYIVYNRDKIVKTISDNIEAYKRNTYKRTSKENLKTTLRKITPKNNKLSLNIKGKTTLKEKVSNMKSLLSRKKEEKSKQDYIEFD